MDKAIFYSASLANGPDDGINILEYNSGRIRLLDKVRWAQLRYLILSPDRKYLYAAVRNSSHYLGDGEVSAFAVGPDGGLNYLNSLPSGGRLNCHLCLYQDFLFCANYLDGTFAAFRLNNDGSMHERTRLISHAALGLGESHPHCVMVTPDQCFLSVVDLGLDRIFLYPLDAERGVAAQPANVRKVPAGSGPRHLIFNHSASVAYVNYQLTNRVAVFACKDGELAPLQELSTLPDGFTEYSETAALKISPDGSTLLVSNRGHDSLAAYLIYPDGTLSMTGFIPTGRTPWDFTFTPDGNSIVTACSGSNFLHIRDAGREYTIAISAPVCLAVP